MLRFVFSKRPRSGARVGLLTAAALTSLACACPQTASKPDATSASSTSSSKQTAPATGAVPARLPLDTGVVVVDTDGGPLRFKVEVARENNERQRGLMYRDHLGDDEGMLFIFEHMQQLSFWMKNTWIPLDMLFIDEDLKVVGIVENAEPLTTSSRKVKGKSRFVLELNGGACAKLGITPGAQLHLEGIAVPPATP